MTIIVGVTHDKNVYIGADSRSTWGDLVRPNVQPKVWRTTLGTEDGDPHEVVFGVSGRVREQQILRYRTQFPALPTTADGLVPWLVGPFNDAFRVARKDAGFDERIEGQPNCEYGPVVMLGTMGRLFVLHGDHSVAEYEDSAAVGSGETAAWGSLHTTAALDTDHGAIARALGPGDRVRLALEAACAHSTGCAPPLVYAGYQFYRMQPGEPAQFPEDVMAKIALEERGEAADDQNFEIEDDNLYWPDRALGARAYAEAAARRPSQE